MGVGVRVFYLPLSKQASKTRCPFCDTPEYPGGLTISLLTFPIALSPPASLSKESGILGLMCLTLSKGLAKYQAVKKCLHERFTHKLIFHALLDSNSQIRTADKLGLPVLLFYCWCALLRVQIYWKRLWTVALFRSELWRNIGFQKQPRELRAS